MEERKPQNEMEQQIHVLVMLFLLPFQKTDNPIYIRLVYAPFCGLGTSIQGQVCGCFFTYKVVNEAFLLLDISDGGTDRDVVRELVKVTEQEKKSLVVTFGTNMKKKTSSKPQSQPRSFDHLK